MRKYVAIILTVYCGCYGGSDDTTVDVPSSISTPTLALGDEIPMPGEGRNEIGESFSETCIKGKWIDDRTGSTAANDVDVTMSQQELETAFGFSASAKANIGSFFSANASVKMAHQVSESSTSIAFMTSTPPQRF